MIQLWLQCVCVCVCVEQGYSSLFATLAESGGWTESGHRHSMHSPAPGCTHIHTQSTASSYPHSRSFGGSKAHYPTVHCGRTVYSTHMHVPPTRFPLPANCVPCEAASSLHIADWSRPFWPVVQPDNSEVALGLKPSLLKAPPGDFIVYFYTGVRW
eukprot:scpid69299/ scgid15303/ 